MHSVSAAPPPLGAGIDPFVLGTLTGNMILVMRSGATERDLAEAKLQIVDQLPIRLIGAVLTLSLIHI